MSSCGLDAVGPEVSAVAGCIVHLNKHVRGILFLDQVRDCELLRKDPAPWT